MTKRQYQEMKRLEAKQRHSKRGLNRQERSRLEHLQDVAMNEEEREMLLSY